MRNCGKTHGDVRSSALWGTGGRGSDTGSSAIRRRRGGFAAVMAMIMAFAIPASGLAGNSASRDKGRDQAFVPGSLLAQAQANPDATFKVIVQGKESTDKAADRVKGFGKLKRKFNSLAGVSAELTGRQLLKLAKHNDLLAITLDAPVKSTAYQSAEMWRESTRANYLWNQIDMVTGLPIGPAPQAPAIAVVDSGVDTTKLADFGTRVVASVNLSSLATSVPTGLIGTPGGASGTLTPATYYYKVTAVLAAGETAASAGASAVVPAALLPAPAGLGATPFTTGGSLASGTYFYKVTALNANGETLDSAQVSADVTGPAGRVDLTWNAVAGASSYRIYRGTASGAQDVYYTSSTNSYSDTGAASTAGAVPTTNTAQVGQVALTWNAVPGAIGYKVYRGGSPGAEKLLTTLGVVTSYTDTGDVLPSGANPPIAAAGDDQGHGTMVAGIAAGASTLYPGVAQNAPIVSIRTADANGMSTVSDVIAAADWILANKSTYNIRVANFSLRGSAKASFRFDPLDKAVERLWFDGVVVVAAAGNHGSGTGPVDMSYAPANDPFIITVGALDEQQTADPLDNTLAWWSGHGKTMDGFQKPEVVAPGRYIIAPVPVTSTLTAQFPERVVAPGYMWMSGTSFAAPVVSGIAAQMLARNPTWGPDQVKGALMRTTNYLAGPGLTAGVGEIDGLYAATDTLPPNPNENFYAFVVTDPVTGAKTFDEAAWASHVSTNAAWSSAAWSSAAWANAAWSSAAWSSAAWSSAAWSSDITAAMANEVTANEAAGAE